VEQKGEHVMSVATRAVPVAVGLVAAVLMLGGGYGAIRAVILRLLDHDRDGPPGEDHASRVWPAVL
jgi:hypothetical protein